MKKQIYTLLAVTSMMVALTITVINIGSAKINNQCKKGIADRPLAQLMINDAINGN